MTVRRRIAVELGDLHAVERDRPAVVGEEPQQHAGERRLAGAAGSHDGDPPAGAQIEVDPVQRRAARRPGR